MAFGTRLPVPSRELKSLSLSLCNPRSGAEPGPNATERAPARGPSGSSAKRLFQSRTVPFQRSRCPLLITYYYYYYHHVSKPSVSILMCALFYYVATHFTAQRARAEKVPLFIVRLLFFLAWTTVLKLGTSLYTLM